MNPARVAALLRELADAVEEREAAPPAPPKSTPKARRPRTIVRPPGETDELTRVRVRKFLRERGAAKS